MKDPKIESGNENEHRESRFIYARVSNGKQEEQGRSLEDQEEFLKLEAEKRGIGITEVASDGSESGTDFDRERKRL